jgi:hypothetical protein
MFGLADWVPGLNSATAISLVVLHDGIDEPARSRDVWNAVAIGAAPVVSRLSLAL